MSAASSWANQTGSRMEAPSRLMGYKQNGSSLAGAIVSRVWTVPCKARNGLDLLTRTRPPAGKTSFLRVTRSISSQHDISNKRAVFLWHFFTRLVGLSVLCQVSCRRMRMIGETNGPFIPYKAEQGQTSR
jgi:hypothetical protein